MSAMSYPSPRPRRSPPTQTRTGAPLGQHFLTDHNIEQRILQALQPLAGATVLEIGAGPGNMTRLIGQSSARLVSYEIDPTLAARLKASFAESPQVEIVQQDFLEAPLAELAARLEVSRLIVFGNLPYYITSAILMKLFASAALIERMVVMMQYEVAQRIVAAPGEPDYGLLSVTAQYYARPELLFKVPPGAFSPPPKVMSAVLRMTIAPRGDELGIGNEAEFWRWMRAAFAQKRKTLVNNWKPLAAPAETTSALTRLGLDGRIRAEDLSLPQLARLYAELCTLRGN
jgi:16S rRNA (adenine1518-N6/adenine1519-N6)-dimethyltransferase